MWTATVFATLAGAGQAMATYAVGDRVWNDANNNGVFDATETGVSGVSIRLYNDVNADCVPDSATALRSGVTNASGAYLFTGVGNSRYIVQIEASNFAGTGPLVGYRSSTGNGGSTTSGPYEPGLNESNNPADNNKDHGTTVAVTGGTVIRACHVVILGGTEPVGEGNQPPGIVNPDTDPNTQATIDLGVFKPTLLGAVGDRVWEDVNHNGLQDAGEPGVAGVTVRLLDAAGTTVLATTTTNASGNYLFSNRAAGNYTIEFVKPAGSEFTLADIGADQALDSDPPETTGRTTEAVVVAGQTNTQIDAGIWYPLSLGNQVWRDLNNNGLFDTATEAGIGGVTVELLDSAGTVVATTTTATTGAVGTYVFTHLIAGNYSVRIPASNFAAGAPLAGLSSSTGNDPAPDPDNNVNDDDNGTANAGAVTSAQITLASNTEPTTDGDSVNGNLTVDFGFISPQPGALGDRVWLDQNRNGVQDAGEPGVAGVTVNLLSAAGVALATTTTDANGNYLFGNLSAGSYIIDFIKPAGSEFTLEDAVADQALDSDPAIATGRTSEGVVASGQTNRQIDAGIWYPLNLGNLVWRDLNNNGLFDSATESGIGGVTVELLNSAGAVAATTTTSPTGTYAFTGLMPGDYSVRLPASNFAAGAPLAGLQTSTGNDPAPDPDNNVDNDDNGTANAGAITSAMITLASGTEPTNDGDGNNGNQTVDFGVFAPAKVGDRVWLDQNGNGIQDAGEPGVPGVTVSLCNSAGTVIATTTTDANGGYLFTGVAPGSVKVGFTNLPAGAVLTPANQGANDAVDSDATAVDTCNVPVTLTSGQINTTVDAGIYYPLSLGNFVWNDANNNGAFDLNESPIAGVTVQLLNAAGTQIAQTTTNATGNYLFTGLAPGIYSVRIPASNFAAGAPLAGLVTSTGNDPAPDPDNNLDNDDNGSAAGADVTSQQITLASNDEPTTDGDGANGNLTVDFGFTPPANASIGDRVWVDQNGNGIQDAGEPGIGGATVNLCNSAGTVIATATTAADGSYLFANLAAGSYRVGFSAIPAGTQLTRANQGADDAADSDATAVASCTDVSAIPVTLTAGQTNRTVDAGVYYPLNLGNLVWRDANNNGVVDGAEAGIAGVTVELLNAAGTQIATTTTSGTGIYAFAGLAPGDYRVRVAAPNFAAGAPLAGLVTSTGGGSEPAPDPDVDVDDNDDNGTFDLASSAVLSAPITLASNTEPTNDGDGNNGNLTVDFGFTPPPASIGDFVWLDRNGNGVQDAGEPGVGNVTVSLCNTATPPVVIATTVTDANGRYVFQNLVPGSYNVGFTNLPTGSQLTPANQGGNDATDSDATTVGPCTIPVTVAPGQDNTSVDAGVYFPLTLGNLVWRDNNNDGVVDAGEPGIAGATVELLNAAGVVVGTTTTGGTGLYQFTDLAPGDYSVRVPVSGPLAGSVSSTGNDPAPDPDNNVDNDDNGPAAVAGAVTSAPITLASNTEPTANAFGNNVNNTLDFGFVPLGSIGNRVWEDIDHDGVQDAGEPGVAGIVVSLCNAAGTVITTATTDAAGNYTFTSLLPGSYRVGVATVPTGSTLTTPNAGGNDATDSDATALGACNIPVTLAAGQNNDTVDIGIWYPLNLGDLVWSDGNNNGVKDADEVGIANVNVDLLSGGVVVASTTTNASGLYGFGGLTPGDYVVRIPAANFAGAGALVNATSSTGGGSEPAPDPDVDADNNDDNGTAAAGAVSSAPITLSRGDEPANDGDGANGNQTVDFGFVPPPSVGDRVWDDTNHNGVQDAGEPGLQGVTVTICNAAGAPIRTAVTTDANGNYVFTNLAPGDYLIGFSGLPAGGQLTTPNAGGNDATDSDAVTLATATTCNIPVTLGPGERNTTVDAGVWFPLTLGNLVFRDLNNNGVFDPATESGVGSVTVELLGANDAVVATTTTNAQGDYRFTDLVAGDYRVRIPAAEFGPGGDLVGLASSTGGNSEPGVDPDNNADNDDNGTDTAGATVTAPVTLSRGAEPTTDGDGANGNLTVDLGFYLPDASKASLGDKVWRDDNNNGIQDAGEPGVGGVTVTLFNAAGNPVGTPITTNGDGTYLFTGLAPGTYSVGFSTLPAGTSLSPADRGADDAADSDANPATGRTAPVTLAAGETNRTVDAGVFSPASLGDRVWRDNDADGIQDAGEPGVPDVTVTLFNAAGDPVGTPITTNADGNYLFPNLVPGTYSVGFTNLPAGTSLSPANQGGDDAADSDANRTTGRTGPVTLAAGDNNITVDAGVFTPASLGDRVWRDNDADGIQDAGEPGVPGVTVTLFDAQGAEVATTTTGPDGSYQFTGLLPGTYTVGFTRPAGSAFAPANAGGDDATDSDADPVTGRTGPVTLAAGDNNTTVDAGLIPPASLGDRVWSDTNSNGIQDAGEPGVPGVTVTLLNEAGNPVGAPVTTDANGNYSFPGLAPGTYSVAFSNLPAGTTLSPANAGADDAADSDANPATGRTEPITLAPGQDNVTVDAGLSPPASIGDRVWSDTNQNGLQDAGEPGVGGVTVTLRNAEGAVVATVKTADDGSYLFTGLAPGSYTVTFTDLPAGSSIVPPNQGADDVDSDADPTSGATAPITVAAGENNRTVDAGLVLPSSIGDRVWNDVNQNGLQDAGELGVPGVTVTLYNAGGGQVAQTTTNATGNYEFPNLAPGTYTVGFSNLPPGTVFSPANAGGDDAVDSDADPATGRTGQVVLLAGQPNRTVDAGVTGTIVIVGTPQPTTLSIRKRTARTIVKVRSNVVFTITVRNTGTAAAQNVKICDRLPSGTTFVSARGARFERGRPCWTIASLAPGQSVTRRITLRPTRLGVRTNIATAVADNAPQVTGRVGIRVLLTPGGVVIPRVTGERP